MNRRTKNNLPIKKISDEVSELSSVKASKKEIKIMGLIEGDIRGKSDTLTLKPYVALKYFKSDWQCFSDWERQELKEFSVFLQNLQKYTWAQVYSSGSGKPKHGLAYTKYHIGDVKSEAIKRKLEAVKEEISDEIDFFELRVNQNKLRVHGFQSQSVFFMVALDRNHEAFPM